ncbi:GLOBIN domain-containing protein [Favolaschia claudopus]|uniref:GLOBIN domain-containing protein n=1 Tax=Favolaschia claudopus TaxID=2862362 RepID=A0AAW0DAD5_9AGAR
MKSLTLQKENLPNQELISCSAEKNPINSQSAKAGSAPLKTILDNTPSHISSCRMPPASTPHAGNFDDPLQCHAYFMSPAETLLESTSLEHNAVSLHDLIEAYNTFSLRIKAQIRQILKAESTPPALALLEGCSSQLSEALRRDLKRAREEPLTHSPHITRIYDSFHGAPPPDDDEIRISRDMALLGQQVLRFLSDIFCFPPLYSIFTINDLKTMLHELLTLGSAPSIPHPASRRIWTLVVWIISVQNLPSEVVSPVKRDIVSVLSRALEGEIGKDQAKLDGLQATSQLLKQHPSVFISPLSALLPCILQYSISDTPILRLHAVSALGKFALAKIHTLSTTASRCHASISTSLTTFINAQMSKSKSAQSQLPLRTLLTAALTARNPGHPADSPFWAVQLLASFVILLGDAEFSTPNALKLTLQSLQQLAVHKQRLVHMLHPHVWKCLVWVFSRLPAPTGDAEDIRDPVFRTLKQDLRGGIGLALILSLLGCATTADTTDPVSKVLDVLADMIAHKDRLIQAEGIALLTQLLYAPSGPQPNAQPFNIWVPQIFDGSLLHSSRDSVITTIRSLPRLSPNQVRQLTDPEILAHWDVLADLWVKATNISLGQEFPDLKLDPPYATTEEYKQNLLHGWQSLLLMPSDLTQGFSHLTAKEPFAGRIAALICSFIVPTGSVDGQLERLVLIGKMWRTMANVFQHDWLTKPAEKVLGAVLQVGYDLANEQVRVAWADLGSELLSLGLPSALDVVRGQGEAQMPSELQRQLWMLAVNSVQKAETPAPWMDLAYLLAIPLGGWTMSDTEVELWDGLLRTVDAQKKSVPTMLFIEQVFRNIKDRSRLSESPHQFLALLSSVDLSNMTELPLTTTNCIAQVICDLHPQQSVASVSIQIIRELRNVILSTPLDLALPLLLELQDSLCQWLEDDESVLEGDVRAEVTECLYTAPLSIISGLQPSGQTLISISRFLSTVADANAFESFWRATYHGREEFYDLYPDNIKTSLKAMNDVYGGSLAANLSPGPSQMESSSVIGSQLPSSSFDYYADDSKYPFETDTIGIGGTRHMDVHERGNSASTVRPYTPSVHTPPRIPVRPVSTALEQLQDYSSRLDDSSVSSLIHTSASLPRPAAHAEMSEINFDGLKRPAESDGYISARKRRRIDSPSYRREPINAVAGPSRLSGQSISEPVTRRESPALSEPSSSLPAPSRKSKGKRKLVLDFVEVPSYAASQRSRRQDCSLPTPSPSFRPPAPRAAAPVEEEEEDYASWEAGLSVAQVKEVQQALGYPTDYSSSDIGSQPIDVDVDMDEPPGPSHRASPKRRSQTVPVPRREAPRTPLRRIKTTSARLDALERAYAVVADDASQIPVEDLVHATRLVHQIGAALNEQMSRKLDR